MTWGIGAVTPVGMSFRRIPVAALPLLFAVGVWAGERAQTSGARKAEGEPKKVEIPTPEAEAQRVTVFDRLLRNRQFDVLRSGNSLGGAIDIPMPSGPSQNTPMLDPKAQKRILEELDRRKNWLVEPGSTTPRGLEKPTDPSKEIPDFSRERGRTRVRTRQEVANDEAAGDVENDSGVDSVSGRSRGQKGRRSERDSDSDSSGMASGRLEDRSSERKSLADVVRDPQSGSWDRDRGSVSGVGVEKDSGWFQFGPVGNAIPKGPSAESAFAGTGRAASVQEFINPNADPSAGKFGGTGSLEAGPSFDPTVAPSLPFVPRDDGAVARSESFSGASPGASSPSLNLPGGFGSAGAGSFGGASPSSGGVPGAFNAFGSPSSASSGFNSFVAPLSNPEPLLAPKAPVFTPRPAILVIEPPKVF